MPPPPPSVQSSDDWTLYSNRLEFETTHFLFSHEEMSAKKIDTLLHLWGVSLAIHSDMPPFTDHQDLYTTIDATPLGNVPWSSHSISYMGDRTSNIPLWMDTSYEFYFCNPHKLVQNILKNLDFKDELDYTPYCEWEECSDGMHSHRWHDLMSVDWAWNQADIIAQDPEKHSSTFVPIILGSDKTTVSVAMGQNNYYPLYLSVGNVHNNVRCTHRNAIVLVGFLAIAKTTKKYANDARFRTFKKQLFHSSLSKILEMLKPAMTVPEVTMCADGHYRKVIYGLGPYIADYEEQVVLTGIVWNWCGWYVIFNSCLGFPWDLDALIKEVDPGTLWDEWGVIADIIIFTSNFPCLVIHILLTPDLLHQLIKGTFKDHLVDWVCSYLKETHGSTHAMEIIDDIDRRIAADLPFSGLCCFSEGQGFLQWTGDNSKALMKVYINAIEGYVPDDMIRAFHAFLKFCYIAQHDIITEDTLEDLEDALNRFHKYCEIFVSTNVQSNFVLPRQHAMKHYPGLIHLFGAPNGLCSSITESKHIQAVKRPYQHSSKFNALKQMLLTNQRIDKLAASLVDFTACGMLTEPSALTEKQLDIDNDEATHSDPSSSAGGVQTINSNHNQETGQPDATEGDELEEEGDAIDECHRARTVLDLAEKLNIPELPMLIWYFLYDQQHPDGPQSSTDMPLQEMPVYRGRLDVFHSAVATFFTPSDPSGTGGMHCEHIPARYDTVLVDMDNSTNSINGMDVARYKHIGSQPNDITGLWMVHPSFEDDGSRELSVIHLNSILRAVHLLPMFGNSNPIHPAVTFDNSLNTFKGYYMNKFADHHSFEFYLEHFLHGPIKGVRLCPIHADPPPFVDQSTTAEVLKTGIKVVDLLAPYTCGGKIGFFGGAGVSKTVLIQELITT
ncbi:hypothetical protein BS17DRAFT_794398 [Gyrodon lividus]|nr:hypothetical protein BS17DRAFT_794398 [Gyrodon lividus]